MNRAGFSGHSAELHILANDLYQIAQDLCGIQAESVLIHTSMLQELQVGRWFHAALAGQTSLPYVGELVRTGKLQRCVGAGRRITMRLKHAPEAKRLLASALSRIDTALHWLPVHTNATLASLQQQVRSWLPVGQNRPLPNIQRRFIFAPPTFQGRFVLRTASGRLGVPGLIKVRRQSWKHRAINKAFPGDDAGHLIGAQFGAPDDPENLVAMNRVANQNVFNHGQEQHWAFLLQQGYGIEATVTAVFRPGEARPIKWRVAWIEISPTGERSFREPNLLYGNFRAPA